MVVRRVIGYLRVSPGERRSTRPSRTDQRRALEAAGVEHGWRLVRFEEDVRSGRSLRRPGLQAALAACRAGDADSVAVVRLDRLTTSLDDLASLLQVALRESFAVVSLDVDLDLATERGAHVAQVLSAAAQWRGVGHRSVGTVGDRRGGEPRGRPSSTPPEVAERIRRMRSEGSTLQAICDVLNAEGVPTPRGGAHWRPTSLRSILKAQPVPSAISTSRENGHVRR